MEEHATTVANLIYGGMALVVVAAMISAFVMAVKRRAQAPRDEAIAVPRYTTRPSRQATCRCCPLPSIYPMPVAEARWIDSAANPHARRLYGDPPVAHIVQGPGEPILCQEHYAAVYRMLESFHARQRSRQMALTAELAREAALYEGKGVLRDAAPDRFDNDRPSPPTKTAPEDE